MPTRRFEPLPLPAGGARRRLEVFSPKLARRLSLSSYELWRCWLMIEANPAITSFCERPARTAGLGSPVIDFWVELRGNSHGEFWIFEELDPATPADERPVVLHGLRVRYISPALLASLEVPLSNWALIVPYLVSYRADRDALLEQSLVVELRTWTSLGSLMERFQDRDSDAVRAALFWLVAAGRVESPDLAADTLTQQTRFRRR